METMWSLLWVAAIALAIVAVAQPMFGRRQPWGAPARSELDRLFEEKARTLRALKDLDHEKEAGILGDAGWTEARAVYLEDAVRLNREISALTGVQPPDGGAA